MNKWTEKIDAYLIAKRTQKVPYKQLKVRLNKRFGTKFKVPDLHQRAFTLGITKKTAPKVNSVRAYFMPNQEQIDFIHAMKKNNYPMEKIQEGYFEQFEVKPTIKQVIRTLTKPTTIGIVLKKAGSKEIVKSFRKPTPDWHSDDATRKQCRCIIGLTTSLTGSAKSKAVSELFNSKTKTKLEARDFIKANEETLFNWKKEQAVTKKEILPKSIRWTEEEDDILYTFKKKRNNNKRGKWPVIAGRSRQAVTVRWNRIKNTRRAKVTPSNFTTGKFNKFGRFEIGSEVIGETTPNVAETMWTKEEDLDLLCNFYEYSIDEARNRFNLPFQSIASRLETLLDSTEPQHIELLMEATKVIKAIKAQVAEDAKNGFWKRRKLLKQAKKTEKRERRIEYRLQRLDILFSKRQAKLNIKVAKAEEKLNKLRGE